MNILIRDTEIQSKMQGVALSEGVSGSPSAKEVANQITNKTGILVVARLNENNEIEVKRVLFD
jgi:hypothetical protein